MSSLSDSVSKIAFDALVYEIDVTPKPGLVDRNNSGSHLDMTNELLKKSACAISPFIGMAAETGYRTHSLLPEDAFPKLQEIGLSAEKKMFSVTNGVNTHKGAIFSFCLLSGAFGRILFSHVPASDEILSCAAALSEKHILQSLEKAKAHPLTHGDAALQKAGLQGARGEALSGFPSLRDIALPALTHALSKGHSLNDAGVYTLLCLIKDVDDTCIYARGQEEGLSCSKALSEKALKGDFLKEALLMDELFIQKRLSPGGCADLLAAAMFINILIQTKWEEYTCE